MTDRTFRFLWLGMVIIGLPFSIWWWFYAPCDTILHLTFTLRDVPVRCINL